MIRAPGVPVDFPLSPQICPPFQPEVDVSCLTLDVQRNLCLHQTSILPSELSLADRPSTYKPIVTCRATEELPIESSLQPGLTALSIAQSLINRTRMHTAIPKLFPIVSAEVMGDSWAEGSKPKTLGCGAERMHCLVYTGLVVINYLFFEAL